MTEPGPQVLVIEDNAANLLLVETILLRDGFQVLTAISAEAAIEVLGKVRPAIILSDIQLPGMDGIQLVRRLRADPATADIPFLALSAHAMKEEEQAAFDAGCNGFIRKPLDTRMLAQQVRAHLPDAV